MQVINPSNSVDFLFELRLDFDEDPLDCLAVKQQQQQQQQVDCLAHNFVADQSGLGFLLFQKLSLWLQLKLPTPASISMIFVNPTFLTKLKFHINVEQRMLYNLGNF